MGTGNYRHPDADTVIVDLYDDIEFDEEDPDLASILMREGFDDFLEEIETLLNATSFTMDGSTWRSGRTSCLILAENGFYQIWSHEDGHGHVFLSYGLREDLDQALEPLARHHLSQRSAKFFDRVGELKPLRVATSPWTSAPRVKATGDYKPQSPLAQAA